MNHAAFVQLKDGELDRYDIVTDTKSIAATTDRARFLEVDGDLDSKSCARLQWWWASLGPILAGFEPDYVAIEDYAYGAKQGAHQIGEVGGLLRMELWRIGVRWRKYTPGQIKLYAAHKGRADKDEMVKAVQNRWGEDWSFLRPGTTKMWTSAEDAADAYAAAKLLDAEVRLRKGMLKLEMMHEQEIKVFMSVSKKGEQNILAKDFIQRQ